MTKELIDIKRIEKHFEDANQHVENAEKKARATVIDVIEAGEELNRAKDLVPHGEWAMWLGKHWNYTQQTATNYMNIANSKHALNLKEVGSIREALRIIADSKPETVPRSERKPADVVVSIPTDHIVDTNEMVNKVVDDDPTPDPPSNRKTAKGSEKVSEEKKPRTQTVPVEIIDDEPKEILPEEKTLSDWCEHEILEYLVSTADDAKRRAKALRKAADKLDPPTKFVKPDEDDVAAYMATVVDCNDVFRKDAKSAASGFMDHYNSNGWMVGKVAMKDWRATARKWLKNQGQFANGSNGNGPTNRGATKRRATVEEVFG